MKTCSKVWHALKKEAIAFWKEEDAIAVVEVILILVVLIGLVLIFKTKLVALVNSIFNTITQKSGQV